MEPFAPSEALDGGPASWAYRGMSETRCDVIIAGAGIAGATLALALQQAGLRPVLVDPVVFEAQAAPTFDGVTRAYGFGVAGSP